MANAKDFVVNILGDTAGIDKALDSFQVGAGKAAAAAAAAFAGAQIGKALQSNLEADTLNRTVAASLGGTPEEAERWGAAAGALWRDAYGETAGDASAAVEQVLSSFEELQGASAESISEASARAMDLARVFDTDVASAANTASLLVKNGLASDWEDAFDQMTVAMQQVPVALRGEVQDATNEYSQFFAQIGFDGPQALGMLVNAAEMGQYAIDKTGDALKELTVRVGGDAAAMEPHLAALGLDADQMAADIMAGGDRAASAIQSITGALLSVQDPSQQAQLAIALFGTPIEDLGTDKIPAFLEAIRSTESGLGDVAGASAAMSEQLLGPEARVEAMRRHFQGWTQDLVDIPGPMGDAALMAAAFGGDTMQLVTSLGMAAIALQGMKIGQLAAAAASGVATAAQWLWNAAISANPIGLIIIGIAALVAGIWLLVQNWDSVAEAGTQAWEWIRGAWSSAGEFFANLGDSIRNAFAGAFNWVAGMWNSTVGSLSWSVPSWIPGIGGNTLAVPQIPLMATGGSIRRGGLAVVGEAGPELLDLPVGASVVPLTGSARQTALSDSLGGGQGQRMEVNVTNVYPQAEPTSVTTNRALDHAAVLGLAS